MGYHTSRRQQFPLAAALLQTVWGRWLGFRTSCRISGRLSIHFHILNILPYWYIFRFFRLSCYLSRQKSVSLLAFLARRFCNTRISKNEISSHLQVYMRTYPYSGVSGIYAIAGEAAIRLFTLILRICRFSGGSKLHRSPQCLSPFIGRRCKDKTFFWKLQHCELNFLFYLYLFL